MLNYKNKLIYLLIIVLLITTVCSCDSNSGSSTEIKYNEKVTATPSGIVDYNTDDSQSATSTDSGSETGSDDSSSTTGIESSKNPVVTDSTIQSAKPTSMTSTGATTNGVSGLPTGTPKPTNSMSATGSVGVTPTAVPGFSGSATTTASASIGATATATQPVTPTTTPVMTTMPSNYYLLTVNSDMGGKAYIETESLNENITVYGFEAGDVIRVCAVADENWIFVGWYIGDDRVSTDVFFHTNMPAENYTLTARFAL